MISATQGDARCDRHQRDQRARHQQLVGGRVEERAEPRGDSPAAGQPAVKPVGARGDHEHDRGGRVGARQHERHDHGAEHDPQPRASREHPRMSATSSTYRLPREDEVTSQQTSAPSARAAARAVGRERRLRGRARLLEIDPAERRFDLRDQRRRHAQLGHAEAGEQERARPDRRPTRRTPRPSGRARRPPATVALTSRSTAGWGPVSSGASRSSPRSAAIVYWVRSLVPSEKKSTCSRQPRRGQRRGGDLDHDPELERRVDPGVGPGLLQRGAGGLDLVERRDHRQHRLDRVLGGDAQDRAELGGEHLGALERQPDPADAEERVRLGRHRQRRQRLVGAGVERAHDQWPAVERDRDLAQRLGLLVLVRAARRGRGTGTRCGAGRRPRRRARPPGPPRRPSPRFANTSIRVPSRVAPVSCARSRAAARRRRRARAAPAASRFAPSGGSTWSVPASPSSSSVVPSGICRIASPRPTTAGRPSARARIAACAVAVPCAVAIPVHERRIERGGVAGGELAGDHDAGRVSCAVAGSPVSASTTRRPTSSTSAARSWSSGSSSAR